MQRFAEALRRQTRILRSYPLASLLALVCWVWVLRVGIRLHDTRHAVGYLAAVWLGVVATDVVAGRTGEPPLPVRRSAVAESAICVSSMALGFIALLIRYSAEWRVFHGVPRLGWVALMLLFGFPVALAAVYLAVLRYGPKDLGIRLRGWSAALPVLMIFAAISEVVAPRRVLWGRELHSWGLWNLLWVGLVESALSEEFVRMLLQTRLGRAFQNNGLGFVTATALWACLHMPRYHAEVPGYSWLHYFGAAVTIMPLGFLWGYMTHRCRSLAPAVLAHGFNLWGLQNFGG